MIIRSNTAEQCESLNCFLAQKKHRSGKRRNLNEVWRLVHGRVYDSDTFTLRKVAEGHMGTLCTLFCNLSVNLKMFPKLHVGFFFFLEVTERKNTKLKIVKTNPWRPKHLKNLTMRRPDNFRPCRTVSRELTSRHSDQEVGQ